MLKKILIINGSPRQKTTYSMLKRIESLLNGYEIEFLNIKDYKIKPCTGCENCLRNGNCHIKDDADTILTKMCHADGIIIGTPVYLRQLSGYLKVLFDRGCSWYHRSPLVGKPIFFVTLTQATGSKSTLKYLNDLSVQWGTINAGHMSRTGFNKENEIDKNSLNDFKRFMEDANKTKYKPTIKQIVEFNTQKVLAINVLPLDLTYWSEKGYIDKPYYYPCKINPFKRLIGAAYFKMLNTIITKNMT